MDAIRKKMQSLKMETDTMIARANTLETEAAEGNKTADKFDCEIRDLNKKISMVESKYDETFETLVKVGSREEDKDKQLHVIEGESGTMNRRMLLLEDEVKRRENDLAKTVMDLCSASLNADTIAKKVKILQTKNMNDEMSLEELDKDHKEARHMAEDSDKKFDEISRRLGIMEEELKRSLERAALAEKMIDKLELDLRVVGENMKTLEVAEEKALNREEKYKDQIRNLIDRLKTADSRAEYGEMNITKLNHRIDDIEDEIVREKLKIKKVSDDLSDTFDDMLTRY
ncbi:tropomyosin-like [Lepeophtheirus salmonis]|uniref:tropomyosin-like n=1 Tax=Lepeophtheirus salmonis TaxID=72036 RepID=UPI001AE6E4D4|nr:tropomyosin Per a 7.0102-like isoform X3 [Lepeophtheirus salmonis]